MVAPDQYLKANIAKQKEEAASIVVNGARSPTHCRFTPVLGSGPQAGDVGLLAWALKRNGCKNDALLLAGALCVSLAMTLRFASIVKCPPVPWTAAYGRRVRAKLLRTWHCSKQVVNHAHQACVYRSFVNRSTQKEALEKIDAIVALMAALVSKVPEELRLARRSPELLRPALAVKGYPADGYMMALALYIWGAGSKSVAALAANKVSADVQILTHGNTIGSGCRKGVAALTGEDEEALADVALQSLRVLWKVFNKRRACNVCDLIINYANSGNCDFRWCLLVTVIFDGAINCNFRQAAPH